ncbi:hypothetical protein E2C01_037462 [Portunus trituberculatus]|uniref:Uncharacterized protein n=1 Tax=Portunus trituberculatus TaxID=210409 RepID=A0A5B7FE20_PORTR|nr:hypothetical protein [Portunus trituberculatus]
MLVEQRVAQTKWLEGTLTLRSDRFKERSDVTGEPCGSPCGHQETAKFEFKLPTMHLVVRGHPITKSEFRQAEICQILMVDEVNLLINGAHLCIYLCMWKYLQASIVVALTLTHCSVAQLSGMGHSTADWLRAADIEKFASQAAGIGAQQVQ